MRVSEFGPLALKGFRQTLLDEREEGGRRLSRPYINDSVNMVRRVFRWGVGEELVPAEIRYVTTCVRREPLRRPAASRA